MNALEEFTYEICGKKKDCNVNKERGEKCGVDKLDPKQSFSFL